MTLLVRGYSGRTVARWLPSSTETITFDALQVAGLLRCTEVKESPDYTRSRIKIWY